MKTQMTGPVLCGGMPPLFGQFFDYVRALRYGDVPDYPFWRACFLQLSLTTGCSPAFDFQSTNTHESIDNDIGPPPWGSPQKPPHCDLSTSDNDTDEMNPGNDRFYPAAEWVPWNPPVGVRPEDLLGDEIMMCKANVPIMRRPPGVLEGFFTHLWPGAVENMMV